uniref:Uncharacterized protein n=1 Tax=Cynoglossus semilaevis TaxID=244447 RepID=A0A3P8WJB7_CYNSE
MSDIAASCRDLISSHSLRASCSDMASQEKLRSSDSTVISIPASQVYREIKQESEMSRVYTREGSNPFSVRVEEVGKTPCQQKQYYQKNEDRTLGGMCKIGGAGEDSVSTDNHSFNRDQIIVEVNLNNQTLNVSKGSEGKSGMATEMAAVFGHCNNKKGAPEGDEEDKVENDDLRLSFFFLHGLFCPFSCHP